MREYKHKLTKVYYNFAIGQMAGGQVNTVQRKIIEQVTSKLDNDTSGLKYLAEQAVLMVAAAKEDGIIS